MEIEREKEQIKSWKWNWNISIKLYSIISIGIFSIKNGQNLVKSSSMFLFLCYALLCRFAFCHH